MSTDPASLPWRTGRTLGRTMYARTGGDDWKADTAFGMLDTPEIAGRACADHNTLADLAWLLAVGFDVQIGTRDGCYVIRLGDAPWDDDEVHESLAAALAETRAWAERHGHAPE